MTLRSTAALAAGNLDPSQHHYPLGYALMGLPGYLVSPSHPFFAVGLVSLLAALAGFVALARGLGLPPWFSAVLFAAASLTTGVVFRQWVVPWNTTPVGALAWLLLALAAAWLAGRRRPVLTGLAAAAILVCRPTEAIIVAVPLAAIGWSDLIACHRVRRPFLQGWLRLAVSGMAIVAPVAALHLAIYGPHASLYMQHSAAIGFTLHDLAWKSYVILIDPYAWFADGRGLFRSLPWLVLALAGLLFGLARGGARAMLAATLLVHGLLYVAYVDLLPAGLWRYLNVHYFAWAIPGHALLAALLVRDLLSPDSRTGRTRAGAIAAVVLAVSAVCFRFDPLPVGPGQAAKAIDFDGPIPPFVQTYLNDFTLADDLGTLRNVSDVRVFPALHGIRVVALRRDFVGQLRWIGPAPEGFESIEASRRLAIGTGWAFPPQWILRQRGPRIPAPGG